MKEISGIEFNMNSLGIAKSVTIDLEKHGKELQKFLIKIGAFSDENDFEKKWANAITGEELVARVHKHIQTLPWKK
jgi:hypothetical protein